MVTEITEKCAFVLGLPTDYGSCRLSCKSLLKWGEKGLLVIDLLHSSPNCSMAIAS